MPREIERKFLVAGDGWRASAVGVRIRQGYLSNTPAFAVRIRTLGDQAFLTVKGAKQGLSRSEYEYPIALVDANEMLTELCQKPLIEKVRYSLCWQAHEWVVDVFEGDNAGLVVAEVTDDPRYLNANLVTRPYTRWADSSGSQ